MNWLRRNWVFISSALVLFLNVEFVVMPFLVFATGIRGAPFFYIAAICATAELFYWYFVPLERFKEIVASKAILAAQKPTTSEIIKEFYNNGFVAAIVLLIQLIKETGINIARFISGNVLKKTEVNNFIDSKRFRFIFFTIKWGGYALGCSLMFLFGVGPFGLWIMGLTFCRSRRWFTGILFIAAGNILKTYLWSLAFLHYSP